jgi:hypothetical protein
MRRAFVLLLAGGCSLFTDLSSLSSSSSDSGAADASSDASSDAPVFQGGASGDVQFYYASLTGSVSYRLWSHTSSSWSAPSTLTTFQNAIVPWLDPAAGGLGAALGLSSWAGGATSLVSLQLLPPPSFQPAFAATQTPGTQGAHRSFDVAYETKSGKGLAVFANSSPGPVFSTSAGGGGWSAPASVLSSVTGANVDWVSLAANPTSDEITLVYTDAAQTLYALTWNGSTWMSTSATTLDTGLNVADFPAFVGAYGATAGNFLLAWARATSCSSWKT